jgi:hydrogenase maturation protease
VKKTLVVGLGNTLVPEDKLGADIVRALARNPDLPDDVDIIDGGTDLLRVANQLRGRELIVLVDSAACDVAQNEPVVVLEHGSPRLADFQQHAHHLSAVQALDLIRWSDESVAQAKCVWFLLPVTPAGRVARSAP